MSKVTGYTAVSKFELAELITEVNRLVRDRKGVPLGGISTVILENKNSKAGALGNQIVYTQAIITEE